jgi:hypothetical protein
MYVVGNVINLNPAPMLVRFIRTSTIAIVMVVFQVA